MNYLIYARVSTTKQAERELSIPAQVKACHKFATEHGWHFLEGGVYEEKGESARTANRPKLQEMLRRSKTDSKVDVVIIHKLDRLCRNVADYGAIKIMLKKHDVKMVSAVEQFDESFSGELVENIMASIAQWTSQNISWEVKKGLRESAERGRFPGVAPIGYLNDKKSKLLKVDEGKASYIKLAFEFYSTGKYSYESLAEEMAKRGLRSRNKKLVGRKSIEHILKNPLYYGLIKRQGVTAQADFPPLISKKLFDDVQEIMAQHSHYADRSRKHLFPLSGLIRCANCGSMLCGQVQKGHLYYACSRRKDKKCKEKYIRSEEVEKDVMKYLAHAELPPKLKKTLDAYFEYYAKERIEHEDKERKSIKRELSKVQQQLHNLVIDRSKRIIDSDAFLKVQDDLLRDKESFQDRLGDLEIRSDKFVQKLNEIMDFTTHADKVYMQSGLYQKRTVLKLCFDGFTAKNQKLMPIWTPVFNIILDLNNSKVQTWKSGGGGRIRTFDGFRHSSFRNCPIKPLSHSSVSHNLLFQRQLPRLKILFCQTLAKKLFYLLFLKQKKKFLLLHFLSLKPKETLA